MRTVRWPRLANKSPANRPPTSQEDQAYNQLLAHTGELSVAMRSFLTGGNEPEKGVKQWGEQHAAHSDEISRSDIFGSQFSECKDGSALTRKLIAAASRCRGRRQELSLLLVEPNVFDIHSDPQGDGGVSASSACARLREHDTRRRYGHPGVADQ